MAWAFIVALTVALTVALIVTPATAACHHYSKWLYPYPQPRCGMAARGSDPNDRTWYVEIIQLPPAWTLDSDPERTAGIEKLKKLQEEKAQ